jgi:hypothetical protein
MVFNRKPIFTLSAAKAVLPRVKATAEAANRTLRVFRLIGFSKNGSSSAAMCWFGQLPKHDRHRCRTNVARRCSDDFEYQFSSVFCLISRLDH